MLWSNPQRESPKWSEDDGIVVKRKSNPAEATVEAWGVVDGQPIGKHFPLLVYDEVVVPESVTTPDMLAKTSDMLALSYALGADGGAVRHIGTRYHANDAYRTIIDRGTAIATDIQAAQARMEEALGARADEITSTIAASHNRLDAALTERTAALSSMLNETGSQLEHSVGSAANRVETTLTGAASFTRRT